MDNEFETPTNVMGNDALHELTARLRESSVVVKMEAPAVVEIEAPPEEPSKLIPLQPELPPAESEPPVLLTRRKPSPSYRWVWPATLLTVALVLGFHGGSALTPMVVFVEAQRTVVVPPPAPPAPPVAPPPMVVAQAAPAAAPAPAPRRHHRHHHHRR